MVNGTLGAWNWKTPLGQRFGPFWKVGLGVLPLDVKEIEEWGQLSLVSYLRG